MADRRNDSAEIHARPISACRKDRCYTPIDFDATPSVDVDVPAVYRNDQTSQEFQLLATSPKLHGVVGYLLSRRQGYDRVRRAGYTTIPRVLPQLDGHYGGGCADQDLVGIRRLHV